jgi:hypothetical protein
VFLVRHGSPAAARSRYACVKRRLAAYGRAPEDLRIMPGVTVVLGDTAAEAQERAAGIRRQRITPQYALYALERLWGVDLSGHDPDGPLPGIAPRGRDGETLALVERWRALAEEKGLSSRETVIEASGRQSFVGTPESVAADLHTYVHDGAADGFVLVPQLTADGLEEFVDRVVPLLQERGAFRTEYQGVTLRSHLGLPHPVGERRPHRKGNDDMTTDEPDAWKQWHERRVETVSAPYGPLALTATHWVEDYPEGRLPDIPGIWVADDEGVVLTAVGTDGLTVDGRPFTGAVHLAADRGPEAASRVALGDKRLFVLVREGVWGIRVYDPGSAARRAFQGIEATPYDSRWSVPGRFTPYDDTRTVRVGNADGRERGLATATAASGSASSTRRHRTPRAAPPSTSTAPSSRRAPSPTTSSAPSRRPATRWRCRSARGNVA